MMEAEPRQKVAESGETMQIGKSRPPLPLTDLPEPEEVFKIKGRIGPKQLFLYVLGPSMIALGVSIGSGEWLVGPRTVGGSDRKSTRLNSSHVAISYAVFCLKKKNKAR